MAALIATYLVWLLMTAFMLGVVVVGGADKRIWWARPKRTQIGPEKAGREDGF